MLFIALVMPGGLVGACSGAHEPGYSRPVAPDQAPVPAVVAPARPSGGLDVPALLELSIDEIAGRVGPRLPLPAGFADPVLAPLLQHGQLLDSAALFRNRGLAMVVAYNDRTRQLNDLLLLGSNESELMRRARLQLGAAHYQIGRAHV